MLFRKSGSIGHKILSLLSEGQADEAWEPSDKTVIFSLSGSFGEDSPFVLYFNVQAINFVVLI
jgi:hypothetical protein